MPAAAARVRKKMQEVPEGVVVAAAPRHRKGDTCPRCGGEFTKDKTCMCKAQKWLTKTS